MSEDVREIRCRTRIPVEKCNFTWAIENFSFYHCGVGEILTSPIFTTGSSSQTTTWSLTMYPNGRNKGESEGKIGIYLTRKNTDSSSHYAVFKISFVGRNREKTHSIEFEHLYDKPKSGWGSYDFGDRKALVAKEKHTLLTNDTLIVLCELRTWNTGHDIVNQSTITCLDSPVEDTVPEMNLLSRQLQDLYLSQNFSDFVIKVGDEELPVHKNILCARSTVFATMLQHNMKEKLNNCVEIHDIELSAVERMVDFIYCGHLNSMTPDIAVQLYHAGERYALHDMKQECVEYLMSHLSAENVCDVLLLGDLYEESELMEAAKNFIFIHAACVQETQGWMNLSLEKPALFFTLTKEIISDKRMHKSNGQFTKESHLRI